jgi:hypothetical protein
MNKVRTYRHGAPAYRDEERVLRVDASEVIATVVTPSVLTPPGNAELEIYLRGGAVAHAFMPYDEAVAEAEQLMQGRQGNAQGEN